MLGKDDSYFGKDDSFFGLRNHLPVITVDDAFFRQELGWSVWGSLGWTKTTGGLNWRMPDRMGF